MSRARRYRPVQLRDGRWALEGECVDTERWPCTERWGKCGHWVELRWVFDTEEAAVAQAARWREVQKRMLANGFEGRYWPGRNAA